MKGYLRVIIGGQSPERFLNLCSNKNILIWNLIAVEDGYEFNISRKAFWELKPILKKTNTNVKIVDKIGLPFFLFRYRKRKLFFLGILLCMTIVYGLTLFVWDIRVIGAYTYSKEDVISYVKDNYVQLGSMKNQVDCAKLEEDLREYYTNIAWISCELKGTQLVVHFKESIGQNDKDKNEKPHDIIALKDGVISNIITREGTPVVKQNDTVKKGDVLISGTINILDEGNQIIETDYLCAQGDVRAKTVYQYEDSFDLSYYEREYTGKEKNFYTFTGFEKEITPLAPKITYVNYDIVEHVKQFKLGHTYYFPFSIKISTVREYKPMRKVDSGEEAVEKAKSRLDKFQKNLSEKGVEIVGNNVKISLSGEICTAKGTIQVIEPIGKLTPITYNNGGLQK